MGVTYWSHHLQWFMYCQGTRFIYHEHWLVLDTAFMCIQTWLHTSYRPWARRQTLGNRYNL